MSELWTGVIVLVAMLAAALFGVAIFWVSYKVVLHALKNVTDG